MEVANTDGNLVYFFVLLVSFIFARFLIPDIGNPSNNNSGKNNMIRVNRKDSIELRSKSIS